MDRGMNGLREDGGMNGWINGVFGSQELGNVIVHIATF